jgi:hypothetical protein
VVWSQMSDWRVTDDPEILQNRPVDADLRNTCGGAVGQDAQPPGGAGAAATTPSAFSHSQGMGLGASCACTAWGAGVLGCWGVEGSSPGRWAVWGMGRWCPGRCRG